MTAFSERNQRVTNDTGHVELLEITNTSFTEPMRIANDTTDWVSNGLSYIGIPFGFTTPEDVSGSAPRMKLAIDNVGRGLTDELERLTAGSITMAKLMVVARDTPNIVEITYWLPITQVTVNTTVAQATASVDEMMRRMACKQIASPHTLPGIF